ncbi:MAG: transglycosylase domain-containing protein, partial [Alphaproteobacteria bacterium]|nr:transglycosylase domain-containing protein [Alphaproteobacteria bacterium]
MPTKKSSMPRTPQRPHKPSKRLAPESKGGLTRAVATMRRAWRKQPGNKKPAAGRSGIGFMLMKWCFVACIWGTILGSVVLAYYAHDLPDVSTLNEIKKRPSVTLVTRDGTILANYGDLYGKFAQYRDLPPFLVKAVLATEDRRFYDHFGVDIFGLARAVVTNMRSGYVAQGGSTITQQLAKNVFLTSERSMKRKIQEMLLALWLERRFSKAQILAMYLNRVYLGGGAFGVDAASERYFGKELKELNQKEMALLAGLLKAPSRFAPTNDPELAEKRATQVLLNMVDAEFITEAQAKKAMKQKFGTEGTRVKVSHGIMYFSDWIMDVLTGYVGQIQQDLRVKVTLDAKLQAQAEEALAKLLDAEGEKQKASQGALVAMRPDGAVAAMVGGRAYTKSQFNRATQAQRQPGSSFKYFVYLAALEAGANPEMMFEDKPIQMKGWSPENYSRRHEGEMTMRQAFATSNNSIAVQISEQVGRNNVIAMARRLGINSPMLSTPSVALGTNEVNLLELTGAYAHVANGGESVFPYGIEEIRVAQDDGKGELLYRRIDGSGTLVLAPGVVTQMADLMQ